MILIFTISYDTLKKKGLKVLNEKEFPGVMEESTIHINRLEGDYLNTTYFLGLKGTSLRLVPFFRNDEYVGHTVEPDE